MGDGGGGVWLTCVCCMTWQARTACRASAHRFRSGLRQGDNVCAAACSSSTIFMVRALTKTARSREPSLPFACRASVPLNVAWCGFGPFLGLRALVSCIGGARSEALHRMLVLAPLTGAPERQRAGAQNSNQALRPAHGQVPDSWKLRKAPPELKRVCNQTFSGKVKYKAGIAHQAAGLRESASDVPITRAVNCRQSRLHTLVAPGESLEARQSGCMWLLYELQDSQASPLHVRSGLHTSWCAHVKPPGRIHEHGNG